MKLGKEGANRNFMIAVVVLLIILGVFLFSGGDDLPPLDSTTGNVILGGTPLTLGQLEEGVTLYKGKSVFKWTDELEGSVSVEEGFSSLMGALNYVEDIDDNEYYFNPEERYGGYVETRGFENRLFNELVPGEQYSVFLKEDSVLIFTS